MPVSARAALTLRAAVMGLVLAGGIVGTAAVAEDEDTSSSVYLVFDPETGEFVTSAHPDAALPNQTGLEDSGLPEPDSSRQASENSDGAVAGEGNSPVALVAVAALLVLGVTAFFVMRRSSRSSDQTEV